MSRAIPRRLAALSLLGALASAQALERVPLLDLDTARRMAAACEALAQHKGWRMNIAVVDAGAHLLVFTRMDRAPIGSVEVALRKAGFSARFPFSTRYAEELAYGRAGQPPAVPGVAQVPGVVPFAGGLPVLAGTVQVGGIGVSGGLPDEDEQCAAAGLAVVKSALD